MGIGKMTIPLFLSTLPEGMTFTIDEFNPNVPKDFYAHITLPNGITYPHTFTPSEIAAGSPSNHRGAKIAELILQTESAFTSGQGASFLIKFTISGKPKDQPDAPVQNAKGTLTIGTSEWGTFTRPDQTTFSWQIGDQHQTYTAKTPTLTYLDDSCLVVGYVAAQKGYVFGVTNQQDFLVKLMQGGISGIIAGHKALYTLALGWVMPFPGALVGVVTFGASFVDGA